MTKPKPSCPILQPGCMMTRSPINAWLIDGAGADRAARGRRALREPITALAPIEVPPPISARWTDDRARIDGHAGPRAAPADARGRHPSCRRPRRAKKAATIPETVRARPLRKPGTARARSAPRLVAGRCEASAAVVRQAPAWVFAAATENRGLSKNARSEGRRHRAARHWRWRRARSRSVRRRRAGQLRRSARA